MAIRYTIFYTYDSIRFTTFFTFGHCFNLDLFLVNFLNLEVSLRYFFYRWRLFTSFISLYYFWRILFTFQLLFSRNLLDLSVLFHISFLFWWQFRIDLIFLFHFTNLIFLSQLFCISGQFFLNLIIWLLFFLLNVFLSWMNDWWVLLAFLLWVWINDVLIFDHLKYGLIIALIIGIEWIYLWIS